MVNYQDLSIKFKGNKDVLIHIHKMINRTFLELAIVTKMIILAQLFSNLAQILTSPKDKTEEGIGLARGNQYVKLVSSKIIMGLHISEHSDRMQSFSKTEVRQTEFLNLLLIHR